VWGENLLPDRGAGERSETEGLLSFTTPSGLSAISPYQGRKSIANFTLPDKGGIGWVC